MNPSLTWLRLARLMMLKLLSYIRYLDDPMNPVSESTGRQCCGTSKSLKDLAGGRVLRSPLHMVLVLLPVYYVDRQLEGASKTSNLLNYPSPSHTASPP